MQERMPTNRPNTGQRTIAVRAPRLRPLFYGAATVGVAGTVAAIPDGYAVLGWALATGLWFAYGRLQRRSAVLTEAVIAMADYIEHIGRKPIAAAAEKAPPLE